MAVNSSALPALLPLLLALLWAAPGAGGEAAGLLNLAAALEAAPLVVAPATRQQAAAVAPLVSRLIAAGAESTTRVYWNQWKAAHGKGYENRLEADRRYLRWRAALKAALAAAGDARSSHWLALNAFSDLSPAEFESRVGIRLDINTRAEAMAAARAANLSGAFFPKPTPGAAAGTAGAGGVLYLNWAEQGKVTPARTQGRCGAAWALAAAAAVESRILIQAGASVCAVDTALSAQLLVRPCMLEITPVYMKQKQKINRPSRPPHPAPCHAARLHPAALAGLRGRHGLGGLRLARLLRASAGPGWGLPLPRAILQSLRLLLWSGDVLLQPMPGV